MLFRRGALSIACAAAAGWPYARLGEKDTRYSSSQWALAQSQSGTAFGITSGAIRSFSRKGGSTRNNGKAMPEICDILIVGAGIVGLAVAREFSVSGYDVVVLEKAESICEGASSGNSGIGCTGYDAPKGSLEQLLLRRSIRRHPNLYRSLGLSYNHIRKCGALVVAWTSDELKKLPLILKENIEAGDTESKIVSREELLEMEPSLSSKALGAVWAPREVVTEPWLVPIAFANSALLHGARILTGKELVEARVRINDDSGAKIWKVRTRQGDIMHARTIINCAGLYGDCVAEMCLGPGSNFKIMPRKGQFVVFEGAGRVSVDGNSGYGPEENAHERNVNGFADSKGKSSAIPSTIIEPVPTLRTKGVILWQSVYGNVICGPTAEEQLSRTDRATNADTIEMLTQTAHKICPSLKGARIVGSYAGIRPATEHRDYQIRSMPELNFITVGGIRSTGLTAASGIAEFVAALFTNSIPFNSATDDPRDVLPALANDQVLPPYVPSEKLEPSNAISNPPAPSLADLALDYANRSDGNITCFGRLWKVTHPLTQIGLSTCHHQTVSHQVVCPATSEDKRRYYDWRVDEQAGLAQETPPTTSRDEH